MGKGVTRGENQGFRVTLKEAKTANYNSTWDLENNEWRGKKRGKPVNYWSHGRQSAEKRGGEKKTALERLHV